MLLVGRRLCVAMVHTLPWKDGNILDLRHWFEGDYTMSLQGT